MKVIALLALVLPALAASTQGPALQKRGLTTMFMSKAAIRNKLYKAVDSGDSSTVQKLFPKADVEGKYMALYKSFDPEKPQHLIAMRLMQSSEPTVQLRVFNDLMTESNKPGMLFMCQHGHSTIKAKEQCRRLQRGGAPSSHVPPGRH